MARPSSSRTVRAIFALSLTGLALGLLVRQILNSPLAVRSLQALTGQALALPITCIVIALLLSATKWHALLRAMGYPLPWSTAMRALLVAWPYAAVTPSRAGDLVRAWVIKDRVPLTVGGVSVVIDRLLDVQSLLVLATVGAVVHRWWWVAAFLALPVLGLWTGVVWARTRPPPTAPASSGRIATLWFEAKRHAHQLAHHPRGLLRAASLSLCTWLCVQLSFHYLNLGFGTSLAWHESIALWPLATLLGLAPLTLAGMGTRDVSYIVLLALVRNELTISTLDLESVQTLVASSGHLMLATVGYTALSSWLFAVIGTPWAVHEWIRKKRVERSGEAASTQSPDFPAPRG